MSGFIATLMPPASVPFYQFSSLVLRFLCWVVPVNMIAYHAHVCACTHTQRHKSVPVQLLLIAIPGRAVLE